MLPSSMSLEHQQRISTACRICRSSDFTIVCTEEDIAAQHRYLEQFHQRRLAAQGTTRRQSNILSDRVTFTHNYKTDIVVCRDCGLAFRNPHPTAGAIAKAYAVEQYEKAHLLSEFSAQLAWARRKASMLGRLLSKQTTPQLVEVGSFVGGFLAAAKEQGWNILGVDPGEAVTRFCLDRRLPIFQGTIEQAPVSRGQLDAVVIWNTFDQLPDPRPTLAAICCALRPDGLLVIRIPHGACFRAAMSVTRQSRAIRNIVYATLAWNNLLGFPYLYGYGVTTLDRLTREFGFSRLSIYPDTLMTSAMSETRWWATVEEQVLKTLVRASWIMTPWSGINPLITACWLDLYYRKHERGKESF